jgi:diguanylate cyclase
VGGWWERWQAAVAAYLARPDPGFLRRVHLDNVRRLGLIGGLAVLMSGVHLVLFAGFQADTDAEATWRTGILIAHTSMLIGGGVLLFLGRQWGRRTAPDAGPRLVTWFGLPLILGVGITIAVLDQLITPAITPFLVAAAAAGLVVIVQPRVSLVVYPLAIAVFAFLLIPVQSDPATLLSNQVNGVTAGGIGLALALLRWSGELRDHRLQERIAEQQRLLEERNEELSHLADHDTLTGLLNRRAFELLFAQELASARRNGTPASLLLFDLDRFKAINDRHGHPAGDRLLVELAERIRARLRAQDVFARWGGEEFLILLVRTSLDDAAQVAEELRLTVADEPFDLGEPAHVTISIGVAGVDPDRPDALEDVYRRVDKAMYAAKDAGRDRVVVDAVPVT